MNGEKMEYKDTYNDDIIRDPSLADWGRKEYNLAEVEMPGLMNCREEYGVNGTEVK